MTLHGLERKVCRRRRVAGVSLHVFATVLTPSPIVTLHGLERKVCRRRRVAGVSLHIFERKFAHCGSVDFFAHRDSSWFGTQSLSTSSQSWSCRRLYAIVKKLEMIGRYSITKLMKMAVQSV